MTAAARSCSPASQSWPATKPPVQGRPVSAVLLGASGESSSQRPSSPVTCGSAVADRPDPPCQLEPGRRLTLDLQRQAVAAGRRAPARPAGALGAVRAPELALDADLAVRPALLGDLDHPADQRLRADLHRAPLRAAEPEDRLRRPRTRRCRRAARAPTGPGRRRGRRARARSRRSPGGAAEDALVARRAG